MNQVPLQARRRLWVAGTTLTAVAAALATVFMLQSGPAVATPSPAAQATPVSVATVVQSDVATWNEFSGPPRSRRARGHPLARRRHRAGACTSAKARWSRRATCC